jgi:hypothetical protein
MPRPNKNRHVHAHKVLYCAGIETATSCAIGEYSDHCANQSSKVIIANLVVAKESKYMEHDLRHKGLMLHNIHLLFGNIKL